MRGAQPCAGSPSARGTGPFNGPIRSSGHARPRPWARRIQRLHHQGGL